MQVHQHVFIGHRRNREYEIRRRCLMSLNLIILLKLRDACFRVLMVHAIWYHSFLRREEERKKAIRIKKKLPRLR